ncbi:UDP-glucuronosyltransferase [Brevibacillus reuszeri]|uniref:UDP-N-acetylglucosamine:LPS N-acetylglucosamine transferase n=1 Tax=Brevibacillus reuszeri TaxID=54915 RepID=A0A0K9YLI6_9BACL|nr:glycosyltransferase [Brevibacillus reuszeri]KNB69060.1 UDP-N-acetylglucosamine:LPS N-acetylglucosamine transferase [Brevibacillus reuszeri]MED1859768.1 glycosyltransferase [Brevibacillus reuszeri]GED72519.1 UDP-glucuronosyltransferase [Brevibacillus reuszeri]
MKKILIFSASIGNGHNQAARAMQESLAENGCTSMIIDTLEYISPTFHKILLESYMNLLRLSPKMWGRIYHNTEKSRFFDMNVLMNKLLANKLKKLINSVQPDAFIATHPFASCMLSVLKGRNDWREPIYTIITDYTIHPSWINHHINYYFIGHEQLYYLVDLYRQDHRKFIPMGIPIMRKFSLPLDAQEIRQKLGLTPEQKSIILSGGGLGLGSMEKVLDGLEAIDLPLKTFVLTGTNDKLYKKVTNRSYRHEVVPLKFISNFHEYLETADLIVTKSGGLTSAEVMSKRVPMIIYNPLPGQEERNSHFLLNNGCAVHANLSEQLIYFIDELLHSPSKVEYMRRMGQKISKPDAAQRIAEFIRGDMEMVLEADYE